MLRQMFEQRGSTQTWHVSQTPPGSVIRGWGSDTYTGKDVSPETALTVATVFACVRGLAETVSTLPLFLYQRLSGGGKRRAFDHPLYSILHDAPNPEHTSQVFREIQMAHLVLWGNAYAQIIRNQAGDVLELWPLRPDRMKVERRGGQRVYIYRKTDGSPREFRPEEILHVPGFGFDGLMGYSPIYMARNAVALAMSAEEFGSKFFSNGARPGGVLEHPGAFKDPDKVDRLRKQWEDLHGGSENSNKVAILEEGMTWHEIGTPPEDAQFLQTRSFQVAEIARIYRYPLAMLEEHDKAATYASVEQFMLSFVTHTIRPYLVRFEQGYNMSLLSPAERGAYYAETLVDGLLRGDINTRYRAYAVGRQWGWFSVNDILRMENMNPIANGDTYLVPSNMLPASDVKRTLEPVLAESAGRAVRREIGDLRVAAKKLHGKPEKFTAWLEEFYGEQADFIERAFQPALDALAALRNQPAPSARALAAEYTADQRRAVQDTFAIDGLELLLESWERELPGLLVARALSLFPKEDPHA